MNVGKKHYKTIFFDWHNTLSVSLFWDQWKNPEHPRHDWYAPLSRYLLGENMPVVMEWMRGKVSAEEISTMLADRLGYSRGVIFQDLKESCESMWLVSDEVIPLVQKLRDNGAKCVIATDNMDTFTRFTAPALRLSEHFDGILNSFDIGSLKFDMDDGTIPFFDEYLGKNNLSNKDVMLIDDCIDKSGTYEKRGFDILQVFSPDDFVGKLRQLTLEIE